MTGIANELELGKKCHYEVWVLSTGPNYSTRRHTKTDSYESAMVVKKQIEQDGRAAEIVVCCTCRQLMDANPGPTPEGD